MNTWESNMFVIPMGICSAIVLHLSAFIVDKTDQDNYSLFTDNYTYVHTIAAILLFSYTYFVADLSLMIVRRKLTVAYLFHHVLGLIVIPLVYFMHYQLIKYLFSYMLFELSTPFLNVSLDYRNRKIRNACSITVNLIFVVIFTIVRILFGTYLLYACAPLILTLQYPYQYIIVFPTALQLLNYWWYYRILRLLIRKNKIKME